MKQVQIEEWLLKQEGCTQRQWKERKRREARELTAAFNTFLVGCFYTPINEGEIGRIQEELKSVKTAVSVKVWGR